MKRGSFLAAVYAAPFAIKLAGTVEASASPSSAGTKPSLAAANLGTVDAGVLRSRDRRLVIDMSAGTIEVFS